MEVFDEKDETSPDHSVNKEPIPLSNPPGQFPISREEIKNNSSTHTERIASLLIEVKEVVNIIRTLRLLGTLTEEQLVELENKMENDIQAERQKKQES